MSAPSRLPFWHTVGESLRLLIEHRGQLARMSWAWLLVMLPIYAACHWLETMLSAPGNSAVVSSLSVFPGLLAELPFLASIAVAWHRLLLKGEQVGSGPYLRVDRIVGRYALLGLAIVLSWLPMFLAIGGATAGDDFSSVMVPTIVALTLAACFIVMRLSIVLPAIATETPLTFAQSWQLTRKNAWRLLLGSLISITPALVLLVALTWHADKDVNWLGYIAASTLGSLFYAVVVTSSVGFLSLAWRHFAQTGPPNNDAAIAAVPPSP